MVHTWTSPWVGAHGGAMEGFAALRASAGVAMEQQGELDMEKSLADLQTIVRGAAPPRWPTRPRACRSLTDARAPLAVPWCRRACVRV